MESDGGEEEEASESLHDETDNEVCVARKTKIVPFFSRFIWRHFD